MKFENLQKCIREHFTDAHCYARALQSCPLLSELKGCQAWTGQYLAVPIAPELNLLLTRGKDWTQVAISLDGTWQDIEDQGNAAIDKLASRLQGRLQAGPNYIDETPEGIIPLSVWRKPREGPFFGLSEWRGWKHRLAFYSAHAVPHLLDHDGQVLIESGGGYIIRFGYYGNTGPWPWPDY